MQRSAAWERLGDWLWFLAWGVASSVWCVTASGQLSATFDEPVYVARGLEHWRTGSYRGLMKLGTMPLPVDATTLPLYLYERWHGVTLDPAEDLSQLLPWARLGTLAFWWLLLFYGRLAGRHLAGPWGGRWAVAFLACEPSFLAHAGLATTDLAVTACLFTLVYHFRIGREAGWTRRVGWPAFWFGLAILAKASALVFGPLCLLAAEIDYLWRRRAGSVSDRRKRESAEDDGQRFFFFRRDPTSGRWRLSSTTTDLLQIAAGGLVLTFLYCGSDWQAEPSFVAWAHQLPEGPARSVMVWLAENLRIFSNAGNGLIRQVTHNVRGHGSYLLGQQHPRALWYYFPVLLAIKVSLPLLLLPALVGVLRPRNLWNWAFLAAAALFVFTPFCRVQIGIRFMLPLLALAAVGLSAALVSAYRDCGPGWRRRGLGLATAGGVVWTTVAACAVWPHALCYVNEAWGGTANGYQLVSEANYDWGQGLKELARWQEQHDLDSLDVWYYGADPLVKTLPVRETPLHALPLQKPEDVLDQVRGRHLAVSTTLLYGPLNEPESLRRAVAFLRSRTPVARTATFLIYDFTKE